jgi:hypothetical protein
MDGLLTSMFLTTPGREVGVGDFLLRLLVAWLAGQAIGWFYSWSHGTLSYSQNFVQSQVLLSMVVCLIMSVVGDSLARAFGLGAALAMVRFRTPVKDARDTVFLFLSVAAGMSAGAGQLGVSLAGTALIGAASVGLNFSAFGTRSGEEGVVRLHYLGPDEGRSAINLILGHHCRSFQLTATRLAREGAPQELVYDVNLRGADSGEDLVRELVRAEGVTGVSLLPQARVGES